MNAFHTLVCRIGGKGIARLGCYIPISALLLYIAMVQCAHVNNTSIDEIMLSYMPQLCTFYASLFDFVQWERAPNLSS